MTNPSKALELMMRNIENYYHLGQGKKAGRYIGQQDVSCYRPPLGYNATAELIDCHPLTQEPFAQSEWWIFLSTKDKIRTMVIHIKER